MRAYLHPSSEADLVSKCDRVLIEKHVETIWNEFQNLLQDDKLEGASHCSVGQRKLTAAQISLACGLC